MSQEFSGEIAQHNGIRQWTELRPDAPVCGAKSIQLVAANVDDQEIWQRLESLRGCRATVYGPLDIPGTGYYSAPLYLKVDRIRPAAGCQPMPLLPDYSGLKVPNSISSYSVEMLVHYKGEGSVTARVYSHGQELRPWQQYARYNLTGGFAFYAYCGKDFVLKTLHGTPAAKPWIVHGYAAMDPETAATKNIWNLRLDYTCRRSSDGP